MHIENLIVLWPKSSPTPKSQKCHYTETGAVVEALSNIRIITPVIKDDDIWIWDTQSNMST